MKRKWMLLLVMVMMLASSGSLQAQSLDLAMERLSVALAASLNRQKSEKPLRVGVIPARDASAKVVCNPLSKLLVDTIRGSLIDIRDRFGFSYKTPNQFGPGEVDINLLPTWQRDGDKQVRLTVEMGDMRTSVAGEHMRVEPVLFEASFLPPEARKCLLKLEAVEKELLVPHKLVVRAAPLESAKRMVTIEAGKKLWITARVKGTEWRLVQLPNDEELPSGMREQRGFVFFKIKPKPKPKPKPVELHAYYIYSPPDEDRHKPLTSGSVLNSGDRYRVIMEPREEAWVYMIQADASGEIFQLFPTGGIEGVHESNQNPVKPGTVYHLPGPEHDFFLDDTIGIERVYRLAFRTQNLPLEALLKKLTEAREAENDIASKKAQQEIRSFVGSRGPGGITFNPNTKTQWKQQGKGAEVFGQHIETLCENCVNILEFLHQ
ncbi:MAG: DUF4384 domain-containing protein [Magnetococcales bacterium]|nr:DUF4384 domain-containing protein [Magnetococcales bacterium]